jgi:hypothetical protein
MLVGMNMSENHWPIIGLLGLLAVSARAGDGSDPEAHWLQRAQDQLASVTNVDLTSGTVLPRNAKPGPDGTYAYLLSPGLFRFADGSWVLLKSHSVHKEDGLGDLTLARTSAGEYYVSRGHVCGKLSLVCKERITSLSVFLKSKGTGPKGEPVSWEPYIGDRPQGAVDNAPNQQP